MPLRRQLDRETKNRRRKTSTKRKPFLEGTIPLENDRPCSRKWTVLITQYRWMEGPYAPKR
jgi:hypothetical protein